ncbi:MAG TPA: VOC family protein [Frateuria sp.]|uniref:VOC family protein n=1 Tax=Frateuria sp. TaxID=2211372 RepID=UPI002D8107C9|nr:VOC family protein [Frateuria sp.]HET6805973.1 VOC family protein [Frateuria sp.]
MRVARACRDLDALGKQYADGLGFDVLSSWKDHEGFDGIILGHPRGPWHLEFIHDHQAPPPPPPHEEHLLVFYLEDDEEWRRRCDAMLAAGFTGVRNTNPFWERNGRTFVDREGGRVVLHRGAWPR